MQALSPQDYIKTQWDFFWWLAPWWALGVVIVYMCACVYIGWTRYKK